MQRYTFVRITRRTRDQIYDLQKKRIDKPSVNKVISELLGGYNAPSKN